MLGSQRWLLGLPWIRWAGTWPARPVLECGPSLYSFQFSKRSARRVSNWIAAAEAEKAEKMIDVTPPAEPVAVEAKPNPDDEGIDGELA